VFKLAPNAEIPDVLEIRLEYLSNELSWAQFGCQAGLQKGPESGIARWASGTARWAILLRMIIFLIFYYFSRISSHGG